MRELLPNPADDVDAEARYELDERPARPDRPWLLVNMVTSADGATAVQGTSGALGSPGDHAIFHALRAAADVVLAGGGTVRAEHYGPPRMGDEVQARREARGQARLPRMAVLTGRLDLDFAAPLFTDTPTRPIVITTAAAPDDRLRAAEQVADVIVAGEHSVDVSAAMAALRDAGTGCVACEGGPTLNSTLLEADVIDEWCLSVAPTLVAGSSNRAIIGPEALLRAFRLDRVLVEHDMLFVRYLRAGDPG